MKHYGPELIPASAFHAYSEAVSVANGIFVKVTFDAVEFNTGDFSLSTDRYTAPTDGYYQFTSSIIFNAYSGWASNDHFSMYIYINSGASDLTLVQAYSQGANVANVRMQANATGVVELEAGDYVELYIRQYADDTMTVTDASTSYFAGHRLN